MGDTDSSGSVFASRRGSILESVEARWPILSRSSCKSMVGFVIPLLPRFVRGVPSAGPLRSAGVTPPHRYYGPIRQALAFTGLRLFGSPGYLASVGFLHGARSPSLFQTHGLVRVPPLSTPPDGGSAGRFRNLLLPSPILGRLGARGHTSRSLDRAFTHRCGPRTRSPCQTGLCRWASPEGISPTSAIQAMRLRPLTASGLSPYGVC